MSLERSDPGSDYCQVSSMQDGGALANDGRVKRGDKLVRVDGFDCMGVPRDVIKSRVFGPPHSEVVLEFQRGQRMFTVILVRTPGFAALGDCKTREQAQLLSSNVRNSAHWTSQAENRDRGQGLERRAHAGACARSQAAELFRGSVSDNERGNGRQERGWGRGRDTRGRAFSPMRGQNAKDEERDRERDRDQDREREGERERERQKGRERERERERGREKERGEGAESGERGSEGRRLRWVSAGR